MNRRSVVAKFVFLLILCFAVLFVSVTVSMAQSSGTGALTGTVTDPSGAIIAGAAVTATNVDTGQTRTTTTDANGAYKFSVLPPGNYKVQFVAAGFKTAEVPSVTVNVTETPVLNHSLEVGAQSEQITVASTAETIQTQNATNGALVGSKEVNELPLVSRNYTQIINLSPGVVTNVSTASSVGNGTQDINVNGSKSNQNNYQMDGASIVNYASGGAAQSGSYSGIGIPNPDSIQEFKVQTSQYDAEYGRNPGANVNVVTRGGTNEFHGAAWEYNRNNVFNANDFFYKNFQLGEATPTNHPQTLKQNTFGGTLGGPIKKDKLFFFGSYQGIRQVNGIGTTGFAAGYEANTVLLPWSDPNDPSNPRHIGDVAGYKAYLGSVFGGGDNTGFGTGQTINSTGSNISNTAVALLQAPGIKGGYNNGFYFPSAPAICHSVATTDAGCVTPISDPIIASENQYLANVDYVISSKNTLSERYFLSSDPEVQPFLCFITPGSCNPGSPEDITFTSHEGVLKLTTIVTNNMVNEARFSFQRNVTDGKDPNNVLACDLPNGASVIPVVNNGAPCTAPSPSPVKELNVVPIFDILGIASPSGGWGQGGNFSATATNYINTFQWADQISWNHGKHTIRAGFEAERTQWNNTIPASGRGELLMYNVADFLTSSVGGLGNPFDPTYDDGTPNTPNGGMVTEFGLKGPLTHYNRVNAFSTFVQDDIKLTSKLTVNLGLRWEYDGFPDDISGQFSNVWTDELAKVNTGSFFNSAYGQSVGTLAGFVVPSNYDKTAGLVGPNGAVGVTVNSNKTLVPGTPLHDFAPRVGLAWQPLGDRFVVRAGWGIFYDRVYGNLLVDNQLNLPPYSGAAAGGDYFVNTVHDPFYSGVGPLAWTPRTLYSDLTYTTDSEQMASRLPMTQEYNLDLQYEFAHNWVADIGYVGTHAIHVYNYGQDINIAHLVAGAPGNAITTPQDQALVSTSLPYNDPANTTPVTTNTTSLDNIEQRVSYLGYAANALATTNTNGDSLYNSLQAQLQHKFSRGLLIQAAYTWSKALTNVNASQAGSGINSPGNVLYGGSNSNNSLALGQQYGLAAFNRPQRFVVAYSYDLPWKHTEGFSGKALSGWTISGVTTIQDGLPFTITDSSGGTIYFANGANSRALLAHPGNCSPVSGNCNSAVPLVSSGSATQRARPTGLIRLRLP